MKKLFLLTATIICLMFRFTIAYADDAKPEQELFCIVVPAPAVKVAAINVKQEYIWKVTGEITQNSKAIQSTDRILLTEVGWQT